MRLKPNLHLLVALCMGLLLLGGASLPASAQAVTDPPLILLMNGDLWSYSETAQTLNQLTRWGYNQRPVRSPDYSKVAYASMAEIALDSIRLSGQTPNTPPANIWVWDINTGQAVRVAEQPANASFGKNSTESWVRRSDPAWSPDGTMLAWVEELVTKTPDSQIGRYQLVIYDFQLRTLRATTAVEVPNALAVIGPVWSAWGLALRVPAMGQGGGLRETFAFYNTSGVRVNVSGFDSTARIVFDIQWVTQNGQPSLGIAFTDGSWGLINPVDGVMANAARSPELYSFAAPTAVSARYTVGANGLSWVASAFGQDVALNFNGFPWQIAVAPSGQAVAYVADAIYILRGGRVVRIPGTEQVAINRAVYLAWSPVAWRISSSVVTAPTAAPQPSATPFVGACSSALPARLTAGKTGRVTLDPPRPNALNSQPSSPSRDPSSVSLGNIPVGGVFTVLAGPVCNYGYLWWQVNYNGRTGWTAESGDGRYWLEPYTGAPPGACAPNLPARLAVGGQGRVTPGVPNAVRSQPSTNNAVSAVIGAIPGSGVFTVLNGPVCGDGYTWWQVSYQGVVGWTPEGEGLTYWLEPLICGFQVPSRLRAGAAGRVTPGLPNALRTQPSTNDAISAVLGEIPAGGVFSVLNGPQCGDGYVWWQVNYNGRVGWTPEGKDQTYWLEPAN